MKPKYLPIFILFTFFLIACTQEKNIQSELAAPSDQNIQIPVHKVNEFLKAPPMQIAPAYDFYTSVDMGNNITMEPGNMRAIRLAPISVHKQLSLRGLQANELANRDQFDDLTENGVTLVTEQPQSTFSIDVDTGSYSLVRKYLSQGQLPPANAVRSEELINYFKYHFARPQQAEHPFAISTEITCTPWNANTHLLQIGVQGYQQPAKSRPAANLVFLIDVSGSMKAADKLPLLKNAFSLLVKQLNAEDRITMVVYAGASGLVLEPTPGNHQGDILKVLST